VGIIKDIRGSNNEKRRYGSNCMSNKEKNKPEKDHADDACYFYGVHNDGRLDSTENPELMDRLSRNLDDLRRIVLGLT